MSLIRGIEIKRVSLPLKVAFETAKGKKNFTESIILRVLLDRNHEGIGEASTSRAFSLESLEVMERFLREAKSSLIGMNVTEYPSLVEKLRRNFPSFRLAISGLELSLFRAYLSWKNISEFSFWGGKKRIIETDITVPHIDLKEALRWVCLFAKRGFRFFKIKLKGDLERDFQFISAINDLLKETLNDYQLRLDMNESYTAREFLVLRDKLSSFRIPVEFFEQPLKRDDYGGLKEIVKEKDCEIVLDESVKDVEDLDRIGALGFKGGVNIKIAKSGINESKKIHDLAKRAGLKLMIGCLTETPIGLSAGIFFASGIGDFDYVDLDGVHFIKAKTPFSSIRVSGPYYIFTPS